jgi:hypothetical protein
MTTKPFALNIYRKSARNPEPVFAPAKSKYDKIVWKRVRICFRIGRHIQIFNWDVQQIQWDTINNFSGLNATAGSASVVSIRPYKPSQHAFNGTFHYRVIYNIKINRHKAIKTLTLKKNLSKVFRSILTCSASMFSMCHQKPLPRSQWNHEKQCQGWDWVYNVIHK